MSMCVCLCVFVTLSSAFHLSATWLNLTVSLQAMAGSPHLCQSNKSLTLNATRGREREGRRDGNRESQKIK